MSLPTESAARKSLPVATGVLDYFPDALAAVAYCSKVGNDQHNPNQKLHWNRDLSTDEADALIRHFLERGSYDSDGVRHSAKVAWRALALLQKEIENDRRTQEHHQGAIEDSQPVHPSSTRGGAVEASELSSVCRDASKSAGAER